MLMRSNAVHETEVRIILCMLYSAAIYFLGNRVDNIGVLDFRRYQRPQIIL